MHLHGGLWLSVHRVGGLTAPDETNNRKDIFIFAILIIRRKQAILTLSGEYRIVGCSIKGRESH
jgi:hypothetical protein